MECTICLDIGDLAIVIIKDGMLYLLHLLGLKSATTLLALVKDLSLMHHSNNAVFWGGIIWQLRHLIFPRGSQKPWQLAPHVMSSELNPRASHVDHLT
jgi:hypothetical protein